MTGGTRGLGKHIAASLLVAGASVAITSRDQTRATTAATDLTALLPQAKCVGFGCDQSDPNDIASLPLSLIHI